MNKKRINVVLIPAVILLWGFIVYRIFTYTNLPEIENSFSSFQNISSDTNNNSDTISISADYRDPFMPAKQLSAYNKGNTAKIKPVGKAVKQTPEWPLIEYRGMIQKTSKSENFALIKIGGISYVAGKQETVSSIQIVEIFPDSVRLINQKEKKTILKTVL